MERPPAHVLASLLQRRFGEPFDVPADLPGLDELVRIASHATHRKWSADAVPAALVRLLAACALSAPSKSDLQQATIIDVRDAATRDAIAGLVPQLPWMRSAPAFLVFCGDGHRLRRTFERRGAEFPNEHLDQFFNPAVDASLAMMNFMRSASAAGLVHCAISLIRDQALRLDALLGLPDHVFPVAGLCLGHPAAAGRMRPRLPLELTLQVDRYDDASVDALLDDYDERYRAFRRDTAPAAAPGGAPVPPAEAWTHEKCVQYSVPHRADWGPYIRSKKFSLK
jgi:FMN reductase [NAD(P)H]